MTTVLIVDDEPANRLLLQQVLQHAGYETFEAEDGAQALGRLRERRADIAIVDLNMKVMSGPAFLKALRGTPALADLPVLLSTATPENRAIRDFMEIYGVRDIIPKPCEPAEILAIVDRALR